VFIHYTPDFNLNEAKTLKSSDYEPP